MDEIPTTELGASLSRALGYFAAWRGRRVVIKIGGRALDQDGLGSVFEDVVQMHRAGLEPVLVHGGGPEISRTLERLGVTPRFVDGLRVTDAETMAVVEMVLAGAINKRLVGSLQQAGGNPVGISGRDGGLIQVEPHPRQQELGFVGRVVDVATRPLETLLAAGFIPVVATLGLGPGATSYNVNADTAAAAVATSLRAEKLLVLTDVRGIYRAGDGDSGSDPGELISELTPEGAWELIEGGVVSRGMIPKLEACLQAITGGVRSAHIIAVSEPHSLLVELFTERGIGTMIRPSRPESTPRPWRAAVGGSGA